VEIDGSATEEITMKRRSFDWRGWLFWTWMAAIVGAGLWRLSPIAFAVGAAAALAIAAKIFLERRRRRLRGYWVEYLPPAIVRAGEHKFAIVYHEGSKTLFFSGLQRPSPARSLLVIPGEERWDSTVEPWARGRRDLIVERLQEDWTVQRCEIVDSLDEPQG